MREAPTVSTAWDLLSTLHWVSDMLSAANTVEGIEPGVQKAGDRVSVARQLRGDAATMVQAVTEALKGGTWSQPVCIAEPDLVRQAIAAMDGNPDSLLVVPMLQEALEQAEARTDST